MLASVLRRLVDRSYEVSERSGFHDDDELDTAIANHVPDLAKGADAEAGAEAVVHGWDEVDRIWSELQDSRRLLLIVSELIEAFDGLRGGDGWETYFVLTGVLDADHVTALADLLPDGAVLGERVPAHVGGRLITEDADRWAPVLKPDGPMVELADAVIRICDLAGTTTEDNGALGAAIVAKERFNRTRPRMHGKRF